MHGKKPRLLSGLAICLLLSLAIPASGQESSASPAGQSTTAAIPVVEQPSKEQLSKLFEVMQVRKLVQNSMKMMIAMSQQQMQARVKEMIAKSPNAAGLTAEQQQAMEKLQTRLLAQLSGLVSIDEMVEDMSNAYQHHLSRSDVEGMIAFYSSPSGQHLLEQQPIILQEYMPIVMKRMQERLKPLLEEQVKEMEAIRKPSAPKLDAPAAK